MTVKDLRLERIELDTVSAKANKHEGSSSNSNVALAIFC